MLELTEFSKNDHFDKWNEFVENSSNGTIFHRLDFLEYHGHRFTDNENHLMWLKGESIFAVMPLVILEENGEKVAKSPYGASFGGVVYSKKLKLKHSIYIIESMLQFFKERKVDRIFVSNSPSYYSHQLDETFNYALSRSGFVLQSRDIFNVVRLRDNFEENWLNYQGRARTSIRKAREKFEIFPNSSVEEFYPILMQDKKRHNNAKPTHTIKDLVWLKKKFPDRVIFDIAVIKHNSAKVAICYFVCNPQVIMTFYMAQEDNALRNDGLNVLIEYGMKRAIKQKFKYFDFGGSSVGYFLENIGVAEFKESFGAKGMLREKYSYQNCK